LKIKNQKSKILIAYGKIKEEAVKIKNGKRSYRYP